MQLVEGIVRGLDGCVGLLEVMTALFVAGAIYLGVKTAQRQKHASQKMAHHHSKTPLKAPSWWPFAATFVIAAIFVVLSVFKYTVMKS